MKHLTISILALLTYLGTTVSWIWAIVEFLIYLVKDKPFNWTSLWCFGIGVFLSIFLFAFSAALKSATDSKLRSSLKTTSRFQKRLDEMAEQRKSQFNN